MRSVRSRLRITETTSQRFGCTTGTRRPCSSRMIECTGRLHDLITQSHKLDGQVIVTDQTTRHTRPYPPARIRECRKFAVENVELETLPNCPCLAGSFIGRHQRDRPARLARIAPPGNAHPI